MDTTDFSFLLQDADIEPFLPYSEEGYVPPLERAGAIPAPDHTNRDNRTKVAIASNTAVVEAILDKKLVINESDKDKAAQIFKSGREVTKDEIMHRPGMMIQLDALMSRYDFDVVASAVKIHDYVINRLLEESDGEDPKDRLRALEKLGNLSEVAAFTERKEITIVNESTESLNDSLRQKLEKLRGRIIEGEVLVDGD